MIFTDDPALAEKCRSLSDHGQEGRYRHLRLGLNGRLDSLQAAILLAKLEFFDEEVDLRNAVAQAYDRDLAPMTELERPRLLGGNTSTWAQYTLKCPDRDRLAAHLAGQGVPTAIHYPTPLHLQPVFEGLGQKEGSLPVAEDLCRRVISLPMHPYLTNPDRARVVQALAGLFGVDEASI